MRIVRCLGIVIVLTLLPGFVRADNVGWFVGGGYGQADLGAGVIDFDDGSLTTGVVDNSDTAWKAFGGYRWASHFAIEAGYVDLNNDVDEQTTFAGVSDGTGSSYAAGSVSVDVQPTGYYADAVFGIPLSRRFELFLKAGYLEWEADVTTTDATGVSRSKLDGTDFTYGAGLELRLRSGLAFRGEWERFTDVGLGDIDMWSGGVSFTF